VDILRALIDNRLTLDDPPQSGLPHSSLSGTIIDAEGRIKPGWAVPLSLMPRRYRAFHAMIAAELSSSLQSFVMALRWNQRASGKYRPFGHIGFFWSDGAENWISLPYDLYAIATSPTGVDTTAEALAAAAEFAGAGAEEPFAHELIREAADIAHSSPRSALLIAVSALETGLKRYLAQLLPDADPFVDRVASPPVITLLQEVVPAIHKKRGITSEHLPLPKDAKEFLQKWITQRNQVAHGIKKGVAIEELDDFIEFVTDLLYVLDYLSGHAWAAMRLKAKFWVPIPTKR
jgi:hypothetical protein